VVMDGVTIEYTVRQAVVWPLVHAMQPPASLIGSGLAELGA